MKTQHIANLASSKRMGQEDSLLAVLIYSLFGIMRYIGVMFTYFRKEKFFHYLIIIIFLMICLSGGFIYFEYGNILASYQHPEDVSIFDLSVTSLYWAIVTITTVGYGDIAPKTVGGRILVMIALYLSLAAVALFTANLTSTMTTMKIQQGRGFMNFLHLKNHLVICGWKAEMDKVLEEILISNPTLSRQNIVIIANIDSDAIQLFRQQYPEYAEVNIIRGDYYNETLLRNANVHHAFKVFILADESAAASNLEKDSKTIMTALAVNSISKDSHICAELLDRKFETYLNNIHVDEIIYSNDYGRSLIANAVKGVGVAKVINNLLDVHENVNIVTRSIPDELINKKYSDVVQYFHTLDHSLVIGLLENVGGYFERKREALREAQKTPDISKLVTNLQTAKTIENYKPVLNPDDDYPVSKNSYAVLIHRKNVQTSDSEKNHVNGEQHG